MRLPSWPEKGLDWSLSDKLATPQTRVKSMGDKNIKLVDVVQVMLVRRILPCQCRACNLWEFDPAKHQTLLDFFGTTHEDIWKVLFKSGKSWPDSAEDRGYKLSRPASSVSFHILARCTLYLRTLREMPNIFSNNSPRADEEGRADLLSGPAARRTSQPTSDEDAGPGALQGAEEEGQERGQRDQGRPSSPG